LATTDARVHYAVLKIRAVPATTSPRAPTWRTRSGDELRGAAWRGRSAGRRS